MMDELSYDQNPVWMVSLVGITWDYNLPRWCLMCTRTHLNVCVHSKTRCLVIDLQIWLQQGLVRSSFHRLRAGYCFSMFLSLARDLCIYCYIPKTPTLKAQSLLEASDVGLRGFFKLQLQEYPRAPLVQPIQKQTSCRFWLAKLTKRGWFLNEISVISVHLKFGTIYKLIHALIFPEARAWHEVYRLGMGGVVRKKPFQAHGRAPVGSPTGSGGSLRWRCIL